MFNSRERSLLLGVGLMVAAGMMTAMSVAAVMMPAVPAFVAAKAKAASGAKWAAGTFSFTRHPGGRPPLPVGLLWLRGVAGLPVKITKHCFSSPFS